MRGEAVQGEGQDEEEQEEQGMEEEYRSRKTMCLSKSIQVFKSEGISMTPSAQH